MRRGGPGLCVCLGVGRCSVLVLKLKSPDCGCTARGPALAGVWQGEDSRLDWAAWGFGGEWDGLLSLVW